MKQLSKSVKKAISALNSDSLIVVCSCVGNPDYGQSPFGDFMPKYIKEVSSYEEASGLCRAYIEVCDLGGGNWTGGQIVRNGILVADVSYNGRVWQGGYEFGKDNKAYDLDTDVSDKFCEHHSIEITKWLHSLVA